MEEVKEIKGQVTHEQVPDDGCFFVPKDWNKIGYMVFSELQNLKKVVMEDNIKEICNHCFVNCSRLEEVVLSKNITKISDSAFSGCDSLSTINLPNGIKQIEAQAFDGCKNLKNIEFPEGLRSVGLLSFMHTGLTELNFPSSLKSIGDGAFACCENLKSLNIPSKVEYLGEETFMLCTLLEDVKLSENIKGIGDRCFASCFALKNITIPESVSEIGDLAFEECINLNEVNFGNGIRTLGGMCFKGTNIKEITLPETIEKIGDGCFNECGKLKTVNFNSKLNVIPFACFLKCESIKKLEIPSNIVKIDNDAFLGCKKVKSVNLNEGLKYVGKCAFGGLYKLKEITFPKSCEHIGDDAFLGCKKLKTVIIGENVDVKCKLPFSPCYITKENDGFVITKKKRKNAFKCDSELIGLVLCRWNEKEKLAQEMEREEIKNLYTNLYKVISKQEFEEFYKNKNLKFYKRLYDACKISKVKEKQMPTLYKFLYNMGAFLPKMQIETTTKSGTKMVDTLPSQKICEFLINKEYDFSKLNLEKFKDMTASGYKMEFTEFLMADDNFDKLLNKKDNFISKCYNEYEMVQKTNTSNKGSQRQLKPTIKKFEEYFKTNKFEGITDETKDIALTISPYFSEQRSFDSAVGIMKEFKEQNTPKSLIDFEKIDKYANNIINLASDTLNIVADKCKDEFTYAWLEKNDPTNLILGKLCNCCAHIEGQGFGIVRASVIHPNVQTMVIKNNNGDIVAKSTLFINPEEGYGVFNTISMDNKYKKDSVKIIKAFNEGVKHFANQFNGENEKQIKVLTVGMGMNATDRVIRFKYEPSDTLYKSLNYGEYGMNGRRYRGDSDEEQYVVWRNDREK